MGQDREALRVPRAASRKLGNVPEGGVWGMGSFSRHASVACRIDLDPHKPCAFLLIFRPKTSRKALKSLILSHPAGKNFWSGT